MRRALAVVVLALLASALPLRAASAAPAHPDHRLFVVSDSVVLGAAAAVHRAFAGWDVNIIGRSGLFANDAAEMAWASRALIGKVAVVAVGYNYPVWNPPLFDAWIDQMMTRLTQAGAEHVFWITLRNLVPGQDPIRSVWEQTGIYKHYPEANATLARAMSRWPQLRLADWATVGAGPGLTWDGIHLDPKGAELMAGLIHDEVYGIGRVEAGADLTVAVPQVSPGSAAVLNITATLARGPGFLTVHACGQPVPAASTLNFAAAATTSNVDVVAVDATQRVCVHASEAVHVIVDLDGALAGPGLVTGDPVRVFDTRPTIGRGGPGTVSRVGLGVPAGTTAALVNVAVTAPTGPGYLTVYPCDAPVPTTSSLNFAAGQTVASLTVANVDAAGELCIYQSTATHVFVDVEGHFAGGSGYQPVAASRLLDTRVGSGTAVAAGTVTHVPLGSSAAGSFVTVTVDHPTTDGYVTAYPCASGVPLASNANPTAGHTVASAVFVAGADLCVVASTAAHFVVDRSGTFATGSFVAAGPLRLRDTRDDGVA